MIRVFVAFLVTLISHSNVWADEGQQLCSVPKATLDSVLLPNESHEEIARELEAAFIRQKGAGIEDAYCTLIDDGLKELQRRQLHVSVRRFINQVIHFEEFRLTSFLSSGVAPKKYFGFIDCMGDTVEYEKVMLEVVAGVTLMVNDYNKKNASNVRFVDREILVTFLAEGGALLLTTPEDSVDRVHPVRGIGLDDYRAGFQRYPDLVSALDRRFGTRLRNLTIDLAGLSVLTRPMTFREAIIGTAVMYLYEKELAMKLMRQHWQVDLMKLSVEKQFIATSLVYNSGIAFEPQRVDQIAQFGTGNYLDQVSKNSDRPPLPIFSPADARQHLITYKRIPKQLTSWSAVYHVLQRYGAWVGIERFGS